MIITPKTFTLQIAAILLLVFAGISSAHASEITGTLSSDPGSTTTSTSSSTITGTVGTTTASGSNGTLTGTVGSPSSPADSGNIIVGSFGGGGGSPASVTFAAPAAGSSAAAGSGSSLPLSGSVDGNAAGTTGAVLGASTVATPGLPDTGEAPDPLYAWIYGSGPLLLAIGLGILSVISFMAGSLPLRQ
jgi:hypothetical protein